MNTEPEKPPRDSEPRRRDVYHFPGITVIVPEQDGVQIRPIDKGTIDPNKFKNNNDFTFIRQIANIMFVDKADYEAGQITRIEAFAPPVELRVGYNIEDLFECATHGKRLQLAYWKGDDWVIISNESHEYLILPPSTGQVAEVTISELIGDPPLAWGG